MMGLEELVQRISDRSGSRKTTPHSVSGFFSNGVGHLRSIANQITTDNPPSVLWNITPADHFGILHAIYLQKLKQLSELGCRCIILIYDSYARDVSGATPKKAEQIILNSEQLSDQLISRGLANSNVEYILESDLRSGIDQNDFMKIILSLSEAISVPKKGKGLAQQLYTLIEIYYECLVDADVVLAGQTDASNVWGRLRNTNELKAILPDYTPPLILALPRMFGFDNKPLTSLSNINSISNIDAESKICEVIEKCEDSFLETLYNYLYFPIKNSIHYSNGCAVDYASLQNHEDEDSIRSKAKEFAIEYFLQQ